MASVTLEQIIVANDTDLITLRQMLRRSARQVGLGAPQQARITAAISEVARALVGQIGSGEVLIGYDHGPGRRPALTVTCTTSREVYASICDQPVVRDACALADDTSLAETAMQRLLTMRMWAGLPEGA